MRVLYFGTYDRAYPRNAQVISSDDSRTRVFVVPTDEELEIARQSRAVLGLAG